MSNFKIIDGRYEGYDFRNNKFQFEIDTGEVDSDTGEPVLYRCPNCGKRTFEIYDDDIICVQCEKSINAKLTIEIE